MDEIKSRNIFLLAAVSHGLILMMTLIFMYVGTGLSFVYGSIIWVMVSITAYRSIKSLAWRIVFSVLNTMMTGAILGSYYTSVEVSFIPIVLVFVISLIILFIEYAMMRYFTNKRKVAKSFVGIFSAIGLIWLLRWTGGDVVFGSAIVVVSILLICLNIAIYRYCHYDDVLDEILVFRLSSMLVFGGVFIAIITALTEGDFLDIPIDSLPNSSKRKSPQP